MEQVESQTASPMQHWHIVEEFRRMLRDAFADSFRGMILYGSCARGEQDDESDIDILVLLKDRDAINKARARISELTVGLSLEHNKLVSAMLMAEREYQKGRSPFFLNVKREGILILPEEAFEMKSEIDRLMEIAHSSRDAAHDLFENEYYGFAASRAYYAMFYAAEAVLLSRSLSYSRHSGVISAFGQHFTREGVLPAELHATLRNAFDMRNLGDYSTEPFPREDAENVLQDMQVFLDAIESYLKDVMEE